MNVRRVDKSGAGSFPVGLFIGSIAILGAVSLAQAGAVLQKNKPRRVTALQKTEDLYRGNCARCHGASGRADTPLGQLYVAPDFTDRGWWEKNADNAGTKSLIATVINGKGNMPAFGKKLKRSEIALLVKYMQRFKNQSVSAPAQK